MDQSSSSKKLPRSISIFNPLRWPWQFAAGIIGLTTANPAARKKMKTWKAKLLPLDRNTKTPANMIVPAKIFIDFYSTLKNRILY